jgi:hypothetical protein
VIAGVAISTLAMMLVFGAPTFAAMTPTLWVLFGLSQVGNLKTYVKVGKDVIIVDKALIAYVNSPAFRAMAAANGAAVIRLEERGCAHHGGC